MSYLFSLNTLTIMKFNYNNQFVKKPSIKIKFIKFILYFLALLLLLFLFSKINFPVPNQEIKKNITNEAIKLK